MNPSQAIQNSYHRLPAVCLGALLAFAASATAANIAPSGSGILGYQRAVDTSPGVVFYQAGSLAAVNDNNLESHVDNWSGGNDQGQGVSFVGVTWNSLRFEQVETVTVVLAAFGDGGWFGPNGSGPIPGGMLTPDHLTVPTVQVSTNGGTTWQTVPTTSDYVTMLSGLTISDNPNPNPLAPATFTLTPPVTNINGLRLIGPNGGNAGPDPNGFLGVFELTIEATPTDKDGDLMPDAWERANGLNDAVDDAAGDLDSDGLSNLGEYQASTDPQKPDTDADGYSDGVEVAGGSDPKDPKSIPGNLARDGTGIIGTHDDAFNLDTPLAHVGTEANINDGNLGTRVDTWNDIGTDKQSYVGIVWPALQTNPVLRLEFTVATFGDGGWFGPNNRSPAPGGTLNPTYLTEPKVQATTDGATWTDVPAVSDYLTVMNGHRIGGGGVPNPSAATSTFILDPALPDILGIRLIGSEGGTASGGFLGVLELKVYARTDADGDGMDDDWERNHGLVVGVKDGAGDLDSDGLTNAQEYVKATDPQKPDTDDDGLKDGEEVNTHQTNPVSADTDADGLKDGAEINTYKTNPFIADTDQDGFTDGQEAQLGSDPAKAESIPAHLEWRSDAVAILGTQDAQFGLDTPVANAGVLANIKDGNLTTRVDTWNDAGLDTLSFVGITWTNGLARELIGLDLSLAVFFDGGWFGVNGVTPGSGATLSATTHLIEPAVQVSPDGTTWTNVAFTSDYMTALDSHPLPAADFGPPTLATARFRLAKPITGIQGVRILGSEGGIASGGFLGVFELAALNRLDQPLPLLNPVVVSGQFRFEFDTRAGSNYTVWYKTALTDATWQTLTTVVGDGTRKSVPDPLGPGQRFYRIEVK
jgi:hypothetical protein